MTSLWQAVPAEVPPTTAPEANAAAIASPTGVPRRAFVIRIWSPPPKKIPRAFRARAAQSARTASAFFRMSRETAFVQPYSSRKSFS